MLVDELRQALGEAAVLTEAADLQGYVEDWRGRHGAPALCVALPADTPQVAQAVRLCAAYGVPIIPQGGNTSLCGGSVPANSGARPVIISLSRMRRIHSVDIRNNTMEVEAGCLLATVQQTASDAGRLYPVSLGAEGSCQIGGTIATNAGGTGVLRYGNTRDNVLGLEVVLPDGSIWNGLYALRKNNTGYDLKHLFIGSEGTLGIITAAVLKLHPLPSAHATAWVSLKNPQAALDLLGLFQARCGVQLSAFELIDELQLAHVLAHVPGRLSPIADPHGWHVLIELSDTKDEEALRTAIETVLEDAFSREFVMDAVVASSEAQRAALWDVRHSVSEANKKAGVGLTTDCAVPVSAVPEFIDAATAAVRKLVPDLPIAVVSHMGDGNVHFIPFFGFEQWDVQPEKEKLSGQIAYAVNATAHKIGGTFSAEHGVGQTHLSDMSHFKPSVELALMRAVKNAFDPAGLFNPGRLLPVASGAAAQS
jgi:FAD/FMN-containing dehydrogenase